MIDAYEIGIQLVLQDDVTAGLDVINRELADVDRAIAATNAKLIFLMREASESSLPFTKGIAKPVQIAGEHEMADASESRDAPMIPAEASLTMEPISPPTALDETDASKSSVAPPITQEPRTGSLQIEARPVMASVGLVAKPAPQPLGRLESSTGNAGTGTLFAEKSEAPPPDMVVNELAGLTVDKERESTASPKTFANRHRSESLVTASINRLQLQDPPNVRVVEQQLTHPISAAHSGHATAPDVSLSRHMPFSDNTRPQERAAAPTRAGHDQSGASTGTVMLDGQLVGQWLSDHFARQASRPPGGLSFFDPRQSPAWNISGAL